MRPFSFLLLSFLLLLLACKRAPEDLGNEFVPDAYGDPPAAVLGMVFHTPYEQVHHSLLRRLQKPLDESTPHELRFEHEFWGFPGRARLRFLSNDRRVLESVRITVNASPKQMMKVLESELEICAPYARKRLKHGFAFVWSDSVRPIFTVKVLDLDLDSTEVAFIDARKYWLDLVDEPLPMNEPPLHDDRESIVSERWEGSDEEPLDTEH